MPQSNSAAVYINLFHIPAGFFKYVQGLRSKSFIQFDIIDIVDGHAGPFQRFFGGGNRPFAHQFPLHAGHSARDDARPRFESQLFGKRVAGYQHGCRADGYGAGRGGRYGAVLQKSRLQGFDLFRIGFPRAFVAVDDRTVIRYRYNLIGKFAFFISLERLFVGIHGEFLLLFAGNV